jgi:hypothetical protein
MNEIVPAQDVQSRIFLVRGHKVMVDEDLARIYGVSTKRLNQQVHRNLKRFPSDFMFQLTPEETDSLRLHFATLDKMTSLHAPGFSPMSLAADRVQIVSLFKFASKRLAPAERFWGNTLGSDPTQKTMMGPRLRHAGMTE